ncbi:hypothetical protein ACVMDN_001517 [Bradyrhizobium sp. USDA 4510]
MAAIFPFFLESLADVLGSGRTHAKMIVHRSRICGHARNRSIAQERWNTRVRRRLHRPRYTYGVNRNDKQNKASGLDPTNDAICLLCSPASQFASTIVSVPPGMTDGAFWEPAAAHAGREALQSEQAA